MLWQFPIVPKLPTPIQVCAFCQWRSKPLKVFKHVELIHDPLAIRPDADAIAGILDGDGFALQNDKVVNASLQKSVAKRETGGSSASDENTHVSASRQEDGKCSYGGEMDQMV